MARRPICQLKGKQRDWTRCVQVERKKQLLETAPRRQIIAMHSGSHPDAGLFLSLPGADGHRMGDEQLVIAVKRRLGMQCVPHPGAACANRKATGCTCGQPLDVEGHHAAVCESGGALDRRHNSIRDMLKRRLAEDLGAATHDEQRVEAMAGGCRTEARLDVAVTLVGKPTVYLDVAVVDAYSTNAAMELARCQRAGVAARTMENKKRSKYQHDKALVPFVVETHGRLGEAATKWLMQAYHGHHEQRRCMLAELSALVQSHTAGMVVAAAT